MSDIPPSCLSVCVNRHAACVRIQGAAKFTSATQFKNLLVQLQGEGCTQIILDLSTCQMMDSTFLGVMASAALRCDAARQQGKAYSLELFRPSEKVLDSLENLDVLRLFTVTQQMPDLECFTQVEGDGVSRVELNRTCLEAHETLMKTSEENKRRFQDATAFFRKNLQDEEGKK